MRNMLSDAAAWHKWVDEQKLEAAVRNSEFAFSVFSAGYSAGADAENERLRSELGAVYANQQYGLEEDSILYNIFNPVPEGEESDNDE